MKYVLSRDSQAAVDEPAPFPAAAATRLDRRHPRRQQAFRRAHGRHGARPGRARVGELAGGAVPLARGLVPRHDHRATAVYTAYSRSPTSGWTVAIGIPTPAVEAAARRSGWAMGAGILVALAVAFALALMLGRRISAPIVALAAGAKAIGRGEQPQMPGTTRVEEVENSPVRLKRPARQCGPERKASGRRGSRPRRRTGRRTNSCRPFP